jgi:2-polyprenyl-6-methoxyphenol hydroxylase-like FAD-dependent oxidoreductase
MATTSKEPPFSKVLISGAGPSGLLLALLLAQQDIPTVVLEAYPYLDTRLRATQYGVPATRIFRRAGILDDIRAASIPRFPSICWRRVADGAKLVEIDLSITQDEEDRMTVLQLGEIIQIMYRHCMDPKRGKGLIDIRFNHKVVGTGQDERSAWVDVDIGNKAEGEEVRRERIHADYLVGCDGAASAVRKSLYGNEWPGQTFDCRFCVQNVYYDGFEEHGWDGGNYMVDKDHWGLVARRGHGGMWRVTYGDPVPGLTDEEYLKRRPWHFKNILPGNPDESQYRIEQTNMYAIHNRCVPSFRVARILLAADAAHVSIRIDSRMSNMLMFLQVCNPMGGYGCMTACLDVGGLADCFIGYHKGLADESILTTYADVRRKIFLKYVDARSIKNLDRCAKTDSWTVVDTDPFFQLIKELNEDEGGNKRKLKDFLMKVSNIEYDFTQHWRIQSVGEPSGNGCVNAEKKEEMDVPMVEA